jgi:D-3-phosphoglycerate dehydrogenase / 2-oxoglutarate reductase
MTDDPGRGRPTVVVYDQLDYLGWTYDIEEAALSAEGVRLIVPPRAEAAARLPEADVVIVHDGPFGAAEMARMPHPVGIVCYSVGMDQVDGEAASAAGIPVRNLPTWATQVVAEHALTLLLGAVRRLPVQDRAARSRRWDHRRLIADLGIELFTLQTVGVVGVGRIGRAFAQRARAIGFRTVGTDPDPARPPVGPDLPLVPFERLLEVSDAIVICAPLNSTTAGLFDAAAFARMRRGSVLVNVSRGPIIDEGALAAALTEGHLAFAALDVRTNEPPPPDDPLRELPNILLTPHTAWVAAASHRAYHEEAASVSLELLRAAGRLPVPGSGAG